MPEAPDWKECARARCERLETFIRTDAPDVLVGNAWHMLWEALIEAYGSEVFERSQSKRDEFRRRIHGGDN